MFTLDLPLSTIDEAGRIVTKVLLKPTSPDVGFTGFHGRLCYGIPSS
jgi:hypothetical protein